MKTKSRTKKQVNQRKPQEQPKEQQQKQPQETQAQTTTQTIPSLSGDTAADLDRLAAELNGSDTPTAQEQPQEQAQVQPTGLVCNLAVMITNAVFTRKGLTPLSQAEVDMVKPPIDKIEAQYLPAVMNKYAEKYAPFIELLMAAYLIYQSRVAEIDSKAKKSQTEGKPQEKAQEQPQENNV